MTVGLTVVEPVAEVEVKVPGVIAIEAALEVVQLSLLLVPELTLLGLAIKLPMLGDPGACTVTVAVAVTDPAALMAFSV